MRIIKLAEVIDCTALSRSTIYRFISEGTFPQPVKLGGRSSGWVYAEVADWIADKIEKRGSQQEKAC